MYESVERMQPYSSMMSDCQYHRRKLDGFLGESKGELLQLDLTFVAPQNHI